jgi:D-3-phosphoglycerate dehydrogenase / 2-oxoglutarate reductase
MESSRKVIFINIPHNVLQQELEANGFICDLEPLRSKEEIEKTIADYTGLIINSRFRIDKEFIDKAINLKFIGRVGSGMESIDVKYACTKGIMCYNSPEGNRDAVGEHALCLLLSMFNHVNRADQQVRQGIWHREENRGFEIKGKTIGIIGYGNMGSAFARRLKGFDTTVIAYDKYKSGFSDEFVHECSMDDIFDQADVLSLHVPLTDETGYMFNDEFIGRFKKQFWLINTARGKVVDTACLVRGLESKKVLGAALDVLEYEDISFENMDASDYPAPMKYLIGAENVIMTPHIAGWTAESKYKLAKVLADKILAEFGNKDNRKP